MGKPPSTGHVASGAFYHVIAAPFICRDASLALLCALTYESLAIRQGCLW
jgi:hypothetical protein